MSLKYIAFDVETPNRMNNRICALGVSLIDINGIIQTKEFLVNPESDFDYFNISLTGITPSMVEFAPTFPSIWAEIEPFFTENTVIAHNALFDLCVLQKTLSAYNLSAPILRYVCTMKMARSILSQVENCKLPTICAYYGIPLNHHSAGSDSEACANILKHFEDDGVDVEKYSASFDCSLSAQERHITGYQRVLSESTQALNELKSILKAISCDGILKKEEITFLIEWLNINSFLKGNFPYDRIYNKMTEVLEDGIITQQEHEELIKLFQAADNPVETSACECGCLELTGKNICLSGEFDHGKKEDIAVTLVNKGATVQPSITRKTNILVVGGQGSSAWSSGNYGTKIKKALELQAKGIDIMIVRESDFFNSIEV